MNQSWRNYIKKLLTLVLLLSCILSIVACGTNKYSCRPLSHEEIVDLQPSSYSEPFVTDEERDELLNKAIRKYLDNFNEATISFTYEIVSSNFGVYKNKETILCWLKIVCGEGFTTVMGFIIQ